MGASVTGRVLVVVGLAFLSTAISAVPWACAAPLTKQDAEFQRIVAGSGEAMEMADAFMTLPPHERPELVDDRFGLDWGSVDWIIEVKNDYYRLLHPSPDRRTYDAVVYDSRDGSWTIE